MISEFIFQFLWGKILLKLELSNLYGTAYSRIDQIKFVEDSL